MSCCDLKDKDSIHCDCFQMGRLDRNPHELAFVMIYHNQKNAHVASFDYSQVKELVGQMQEFLAQEGVK